MKFLYINDLKSYFFIQAKKKKDWDCPYHIFLSQSPVWGLSVLRAKCWDKGEEKYGCCPQKGIQSSTGQAKSSRLQTPLRDGSLIKPKERGCSEHLSCFSCPNWMVAQSVSTTSEEPCPSPTLISCPSQSNLEDLWVNIYKILRIALALRRTQWILTTY